MTTLCTFEVLYKLDSSLRIRSRKVLAPDHVQAGLMVRDAFKDATILNIICLH